MKKLKIRIYIANPYGFTELGKRFILYGHVLPGLQKIIYDMPAGIREQVDFLLIEPFAECGKELNLKYLDALELYKEHLAFWKVFCDKVGTINYSDIDRADMVLAILDWHDSGVAAEVGYAAKKGNTPIMGLMSDFRPCENMATNVNCMISKAIQISEGSYIFGENCIERWFKSIEKEILEVIIKKRYSMYLTNLANNHLSRLSNFEKITSILFDGTNGYNAYNNFGAVLSPFLNCHKLTLMPPFGLPEYFNEIENSDFLVIQDCGNISRSFIHAGIFYEKRNGNGEPLKNLIFILVDEKQRPFAEKLGQVAESPAKAAEMIKEKISK